MVMEVFNPKDALRDLRMMEHDAIERIKALEEQYAKAVSQLQSIRRQIRQIQDDN